MKKLLLLFLAIISLPIYAQVEWDSSKKMYYSTSCHWRKNMSREKYDILAKVANECISAAVVMGTEERHKALRHFIKFLLLEGSCEASILLLDLDDIFREGDE